MKVDVVVIGGGHAGIEAANASAKLGLQTMLLSMDDKAIGRMSCNPAIGGVAKGQLVRDIDALGGLMGVASDIAGIQFRMLNLSKGPAVWGPRAQMDMELYADTMQSLLKQIPTLTLLKGELKHFKPEKEGGFTLDTGAEKIYCKALIITSGTFLGAKMYTGLNATVGGRIGEPASVELSQTLKDLGLKTRRLKTGTPARLEKSSIDYALTEVQYGDENPFAFSFRTNFQVKNHATCWITHTSEATHDILRTGFAESPMFTGMIEGIGPRYCPSIEDKIGRFADKTSHHLFLEPEGLNNNRIYVNGFSSSLPAPIQDAALRTIPGLKNCQVLRYGYAVEYDSVDATQLLPTYECKDVPGLYFAGQVNGTSGYEEAAAQGLLAGINAALKIKGQEALILSRADSYIGVMTDDLISMDLEEPYRMFTSRAEYRLHLRQDNAEERLLEKGYKLGVIDESTWEKYLQSRQRLTAMREKLSHTKSQSEPLNDYLVSLGSAKLDESVDGLSLLKRPSVDLAQLLNILGIESTLDKKELLELEAGERYRGFWERQLREIDRNRKLSVLMIPTAFNYSTAHALSTEARQKLAAKRPATVGLAQRISGVTPADISGLIFHLQQKPHSNSASASTPASVI